MIYVVQLFSTCVVTLCLKEFVLENVVHWSFSRIRLHTWSQAMRLSEHLWCQCCLFLERRVLSSSSWSLAPKTSQKQRSLVALDSGTWQQWHVIRRFEALSFSMLISGSQPSMNCLELCTCQLSLSRRWVQTWVAWTYKTGQEWAGWSVVGRMSWPAFSGRETCPDISDASVLLGKGVSFWVRSLWRRKAWNSMEQLQHFELNCKGCVLKARHPARCTWRAEFIPCLDTSNFSYSTWKVSATGKSESKQWFGNVWRNWFGVLKSCSSGHFFAISPSMFYAHEP